MNRSGIYGVNLSTEKRVFISLAQAILTTDLPCPGSGWPLLGNVRAGLPDCRTKAMAFVVLINRGSLNRTDGGLFESADTESRQAKQGRFDCRSVENGLL